MKPKKKVKKKFNLSEFVYGNFNLSLNYIKKVKNYIWFSLVLFSVIGLIGYLFPIFFEKQITDLIKEIIRQTEGLDILNLIRFIFINNLISSFFAVIFGIFLGIVPFFVLVINGYILGFVANKTISGQGFSVLWRLIPHGIFELPAVIISIGLGLRLGSFLFVSKKRDWQEFRKWLIDVFRVFVFVIIPLLIIAAIIEGVLISVFG